MKFNIVDGQIANPSALLVRDVDEHALFMIEGKAGLFIKAQYARMFCNSKMLSDIANRGDCLLFDLSTHTLAYSPASATVSSVFSMIGELQLKPLYKRSLGWIS